MLAEILRRIGVAGGGFVEFGIQDGSEGTTVFLAQVLGWPGVYLEADATAYEALERRFSANPRVRTCTPPSSRTTSSRCSSRPECPTSRTSCRSTSTATTTGSGGPSTATGRAWW